VDARVSRGDLDVPEGGGAPIVPDACLGRWVPLLAQRGPDADADVLERDAVRLDIDPPGDVEVAVGVPGDVRDEVPLVRHQRVGIGEARAGQGGRLVDPVDELGLLPRVAGAAPGARVAARSCPRRASAGDPWIVLLDAARTANDGPTAGILEGTGAALGVTPGVPSRSPVFVAVAPGPVPSVARRRDDQRYDHRDEHRAPTATSSVPAKLHGHLGSQGEI